MSEADRVEGFRMALEDGLSKLSETRAAMKLLSKDMEDLKGSFKAIESLVVVVNEESGEAQQYRDDASKGVWHEQRHLEPEKIEAQLRSLEERVQREMPRWIAAATCSEDGRCQSRSSQDGAELLS